MKVKVQSELSEFTDTLAGSDVNIELDINPNIHIFTEQLPPLFHFLSMTVWLCQLDIPSSYLFGKTFG